LRFSGAVQRKSAAPQTRELYNLGILNDPGSAARHFVLRCARETRCKFPDKSNS
jgi:hypothetical protein